MMDQLDHAARAVIARRREKTTLVVTWHDAWIAWNDAVAKRDQLVARRERAVCALLRMTPAEVKWAKRRARTGEYPATIVARANYATFVHHRKQLDGIEAEWTERIAIAQGAVDETAAALSEAARALLWAAAEHRRSRN